MAIAWRVSPRRFLMTVALLIVGGVAAPLISLCFREVTSAALSHDLLAATLWAVAVPVLALAVRTAGGISTTFWYELAELQMIELDRELANLVQGAPSMEVHESPDIADRVELLRGAQEVLRRAVPTVLSVATLYAVLLFTTVLLLSVEPLLVLLPLFAVPALVGGQLAKRRRAREEASMANRWRLQGHLMSLVADPGPAKEIRVFGIQEYLAERLFSVRQELRRSQVRAEVFETWVAFVGQGIFAVGYTGALMIVVRRALEHRGSVPNVVLVLSLAGQVAAQVFGMVWVTQSMQALSAAGKRLLWLRRVLSPVGSRPLPGSHWPPGLTGGLDLDQVSFRYPGTERYVLRDISAHLPAGSTVALVGENGAGKSTLVKLLCGFYPPTSGQVTADGTDLADVGPSERHAQLAAGFQDYARLEFIAQQSVGLGRIEDVEDRAAVAAAVHRAAAGEVIAQLPNGLETPLGRSFPEGRDLSGGQWQRLAVARALMRQSPLLLVLDEPTAALDAQAEHDLFERYAVSARAAASERRGIAVIVSHRLSTARMADLILVLENGSIVEQGSHGELMANGGLYAELFSLQSAAYT